MSEKVFIGDTVKQLRQALNLSQADLSRLTGLRHGFISELEANKKEPGAGTLLKLSHALGASVDDLLQAIRDEYLKNNGQK